MKTKIIAFSTLFTLLLGLSACENFLTEEPKDFISPDNFPQTAGDADLMLTGAMSPLPTSNLYQRALYMLAELSSDHTMTPFVDGPRPRFDEKTYTSNNQYIDWTWTAFYEIINDANMMIESLPNSDMSEDDINSYVASAKFLRGFSYFHLVRLFGEIPLIEEPVTDFGGALDMGKSSVEDVYDFIIKDLEEAEDHIPEPGEWERGKPDLGATKALLADVYITAAGWPLNDDSMWERAAAKAKEVKDMGYDLVDDFGDLWLIEHKNNEEFIFHIDNTSESGGSSMTVQALPSNLENNAGWAFWNSYETFMNEFDADDTRREASFLTEAEGMTYHDFYGRGEPYLKKWTDIGRDNLAERGNNTDTQIPIYRYAEILLFIAEAENEANSGPTPEAYLAINEVRERAGIDPLSGLGQEQFREAVRKEREFELAFELKRFYDIKRWDIFMEVFTEYPNSQGNVQEHHVYYPIPQREIQLNPGLGPNEGYN